MYYYVSNVGQLKGKAEKLPQLSGSFPAFFLYL